MNTKENQQEEDKPVKTRKTEYMKQYMKEYYLNHIDTILTKSLNNIEPMKCHICSCSVQKKSISMHRKTRKHINNLNSIQNIT